ncbi:barwin-like endoglucanase [Trametes cingulata]|nr:barwin-like endoglucanase [Trametes cingulata]
MHFLSLASLALAVSGASAIAIPRSHVHSARAEKPATYAEGYLEPYATYHARYLAIGCENQHNTPFFDACCHPMLATETLAKNRAPECDPANHISSSVVSAAPTTVAAVHTSTASSAQPAATQNLSTSGDDDDDEDCDDEDDEPTSTVSSAAPTSTDDDDDEDCEDEDDEPSSSAAPTSHAATSTHVSPAPTSSTHAPAPSSTHSVAPTSTHAPSSTHSATPTKASSTPAPTSGNSNKGPFTGNATYYLQNGVAGACGAVNPDSAHIAAMQTERYGDLSRKSSLCGQQVKITNKNNGKSVVVTIADACPTCGTGNDIDLSVGAFTQIATEEEGEVPISWEFL